MSWSAIKWWRMPPSFTDLMFARCWESSLTAALCTPTGMTSTPSSFSTVRPWEGRAPPAVSHRALRRSSRPWRGRNGASWSGSSPVWRRSRGTVDRDLGRKRHKWVFGFLFASFWRWIMTAFGCDVFFHVLVSQESPEGIWAATGAARPARSPPGRPVGVGNFLQPPRRGRSLSRGQTVAATQRPPGGPHAHTGGTQQTAGVSAASPTPAPAPGNTSGPVGRPVRTYLQPHVTEIRPVCRVAAVDIGACSCRIGLSQPCPNCHCEECTCRMKDGFSFSPQQN